VIVSELAGSRRLSLQLVNDAARVLASGRVEFGRVLWLADAGPLCCGHRLGGARIHVLFFVFYFWYVR
jgi:hypothetical protein